MRTVKGGYDLDLRRREWIFLEMVNCEMNTSVEEKTRMQVRGAGSYS